MTAKVRAVAKAAATATVAKARIVAKVKVAATAKAAKFQNCLFNNSFQGVELQGFTL